LKTRHKQCVYYVIETKDKFINSICTPIYNNTYILEVQAISEDRQFFKVKGAKDFKLYEINVEGLTRLAELKQIINLILN
jgi:hypothetical protein